MAGLSLRVLGCATPYPSPGNACSGYLLTTGDTRVWVDAGTGTLAELQRHARLDELDAIWVSHLHADHSADLLATFYALRYGDLTPVAPIPLYGPPGVADRLAGFLTNGPERAPIEEVFAVAELYDGHSVTIGGLTLTSRAVEHGVPAFALRAEAAGASIVYSGDCAPCAALTELAAGSDLLLCEVGNDAADAELPHHTPEQAGETAGAAGARELLLTHIARSIDPSDAVTRAATRFEGPIGHARPDTEYAVSASR
jgi:ribonuclease BN (tRNA processing enzyme)